MSRSPALPAAQTFRWPIRVYYEDTDFSGLVYHAAYLKFLERARTEWLRSLGFDQREIVEKVRLVFAVRRLSIEYHRPARMDDQLEATAVIEKLGGASITFEQALLRGDELLTEASVEVVALREGRPTRIPGELRERLMAQV